MATRRIVVVAAALSLAACMGGPPEDLSTTRELALEDGVFLTSEYRQSLATFDKVLIDPVKVLADPDARVREQDAVEMTAFARHLYLELRRQLSGRYEVVDRPALGVVRVRASVHGIDPSDRSLNVRPWSGPFGLWRGGAVLRVDFSNALTGQHVASMVADGDGEDHRARAGTRAWSHATDVLSYWAQLVRETMDVEHGTYGL